MGLATGVTLQHRQRHEQDEFDQLASVRKSPSTVKSTRRKGNKLNITEQIEETLKNDRRMKTTKRRLNIIHQFVCLKDVDDNITSKMEEVSRVPAKF